ncbi:hypothetical protein IT412_05810 [Candidatus Peregrinibacteria bacterium]|nr:hypothetical protein [Candidatus Peregrinibacteria bacterium]
MQLQPNSDKQSGQIPPALTQAQLDQELTQIGQLSKGLSKLDESHPTEVSREIAAALAKWDMESANSSDQPENTLQVLTPTFIAASLASIAESKALKAAEEERLKKLELEQAEPSVIASVRALIQEYNERMARAAEPYEPSINYLPELLATAADSESIAGSIEKTSIEGGKKSLVKSKSTPDQETVAELEDEDLLLTLENLPARKSLKRTEVADLYHLLTNHGQEQEVWNFISRASDHPINAWVIHYNLINNPGVITLESLESLMFYGPVIDEVEMLATGEKKTAILYGGKNIGKGGQAEVAKVFHVILDTKISQITDFNKENFQLNQSAIKITLLDDNEGNSELNMQHEKSVAKDVYSVIKEYQGAQTEQSLADFDPEQHIALPVAFGTNFSLSPLIEVSPDRVVNLRSMGRLAETPKQFTQQLIGPMKLLSLFTKNGIVDADTTDQNILVSGHGGVLIDLGGFISEKLVKEGTIKYRVDSGLTTVTYPNDAIFYSPAFTHFLLFHEELSNPEFAGMIHKLALGRVLERYLVNQGYETKEHFDKFTESISLQGKIKHQPVLLEENQFRNSADKSIYDLCRKLLNSAQHPCQYKGNDQSKGLDPDYISLDDAILIVEELNK